jgi:hypothetical protein
MRKSLGATWLGKLLTAGLSFAFSVGAYCADVAPAIASEPTAVAGTTVTMTPPEGFVPATDFAGFANLEKQGSFFVVELPAEAMGTVSKLFKDREVAAKSFAIKGITVTEREEIKIANGEMVPLLHGTQKVGSIVFDKWMALYGGKKTVLITFQIPQENALDRRALKAVFASVSTGLAPSLQEKLAVLPFKIEAAGPFRIIDALGGSSVLMTAGDKDVDPEGLQPMIVIVVAQASGDISNLEALAESNLRSMRGFQTAEVTARKETTFVGTDGYLLKGTYDDKGKKKSFLQYFGVKGARAICLIGSADEKQLVTLQATIEKIAASVALRE